MAGAFVLLTFVVASVFARFTYLAIDDVERDIIIAEQREQLEWLIARERAGAEPIRQLPRGERVYIGPDPALPAFLRDLDPGWHERRMPQQPAHVLVRRDGARTWYLVDDQHLLEQRENFWIRFLGGAVVVATLAALLLGLGLAHSALAPVRRLAGRVAALRPGEDPATLADGYPDDPVGTLARTFEARMRELRGLLEQEQVFTGDVSHELRTPAAIIAGAAEVLAEQPELSERSRAATQRIATACADLQALIEAFLTLGRTPAALARRQCRLDEIVRTQLARVRETAGRNGLALTLDAAAPVTVDAPAMLLAVAVRNLVDNAVRHGGNAPIRVSVLPGEVRVEDAGPGLDARARAWLFRRHVRGAPAGVPGSGLGLAIVARICERAGWRVEVEPRAPGACFRLLLPASSQDPHATLTQS